MTVADDFCSLDDACKISTEKVRSIGYRYRGITCQLNRTSGPPNRKSLTACLIDLHGLRHV